MTGTVQKREADHTEAEEGRVKEDSAGLVILEEREGGGFEQWQRGFHEARAAHK